MANLFINVHLSKAKLPLFRDGNYFLIASTFSAYSPQQMLLRFGADSSNRSSRNTLYDRRSSRFDIAFHGMSAETNPNMRYRFHVSCWYSELSKCLSANLERLICHFTQDGSSWMWNLDFLCKLTIVISRLPCLYKMANAVSSTVVLFNSVTSDSVN